MNRAVYTLASGGLAAQARLDAVTQNLANVGTGDVASGDDGQISVAGISGGRLKLVGFGEHPPLMAEGNALFAPASGAVPVPIDATATHVEQGSLEAANIDAVKGMIELVEVSRGFEQYMHAMQRLDEIAQRSINEVGRIG